MGEWVKLIDERLVNPLDNQEQCFISYNRNKVFQKSLYPRSVLGVTYIRPAPSTRP